MAEREKQRKKLLVLERESVERERDRRACGLFLELIQLPLTIS